MASLIRPYVDKENAPSAGAAARKGRLQSLGSRPAIGKTFGNDNPQKPQTPRQVLGNISNDRSAVRLKPQGRPPTGKPDPFQPLKQPSVVKRPVGLSNRKSSTPGQPLLKKKTTTKPAPPVFKLPTSIISDNLPPIEQMHVFEDKEFHNGLPLEHCLSSCLGKWLPVQPPSRKRTIPTPPPFDASSLTFETAIRPIFADEKPLMPTTEFESCLELPPVETIDFLDINNIKLWD